MEYRNFYTKYGIKTKNAISSIVPDLLEEFEFPKGSVMHYVSVGTEFGPDVNHPLLKNFDKEIYVNHKEEAVNVRGSVKAIKVDVNKLSLQFHRRYLRFNKMRKVSSATSNHNNLVIENYAPLTQLYRYRRTVFSIYDEYYNLLNTLVQGIESSEYYSDIHHWIPLEIPETLPSIESLRLNANDVRRDDLADYHEMSDVVVLELWRFLTHDVNSDETEGLSLFEYIPESLRSRVNLVWTESGSWSWLNLGDLDAWRREANGEELAKRLLTFLERLLEERTPVTFEEEGLGSELEHFEDVPEEVRLSKPILDRANALVEAGRMSGNEFKRIEKLSTRYTTIPAPDGNGTLQDYMKIKPEDLDVTSVRMPEISTVVDKSMLKSTLMDFEKKYIKNVMGKDIANFTMSLQQAGFAVLDLKQEKEVDYANNSVTYSVKVQPADGSVSTIKFTINTINEDGTYVANGVKRRMSIQPGDLPIRKVLSNRVSLTSYYGKNFVTASERTVHDYGTWLAKNITTMSMEADSSINDVHFGDYGNMTSTAPKAYTGIAARMSGFTHLGYTYNFDISKLEGFAPGAVAMYEKDKLLVIAKNKAGDMYAIDSTNTVWAIAKGKGPVVKGLLEEILYIEGRPPVDMAELGVMGKTIPLGIVLGYHLGLNGLLKKLRLKPRWVPRGKRVEHSNTEFIIVFKDETLILPRTNATAAMIMSGFNMYRTQIRDYNSHELNKPDAYRRLLTSVGLTAGRYAKELDLMQDMFIDHVTLSILKDMKEPTKLIDLYIRAAELLTTDEHPDEVDPEFMRYRGYERIGGLLYAELVKAVRTYRRNPSGSSAKLSLHPKAVTMAIAKDASVALVEEINPIVQLKEQEMVTFSGTGGRSAQSMTAKARVYLKNNLGTISEAGVDSGKVGINTYLSSDPKFTTVRGRTARYDENEDSMVRVMSTAANLAPFSDRADGKRIAFIGIQQGSSVGSPNYRAMPISSGMDKVIAQRVTKMYAIKADFDGVVVDVDDEYLTFDSKDGKDRVVADIGTHFGVVAGTYIPHRIVCDVKKGHKFKQGDILAFNSAFFERDGFDPSQVQYKMGIIVNTTFMESSDTLEDSSAIHKSISDQLTLETTKLRTVSVSFTDNISNLVSEGDKVGVNDILCTLTDPASGDDSKFDEASLELIDGLAATTPKSEISGKVERIEIVYYGDKENMSESLRKLVNISDRRLNVKAKRIGGDDLPTSGRVNMPIRVGGVPLVEGNAIIKIYITKGYKSGAGNKGVFSNQLKTVYGRVFTEKYETLSGIPIHAIFAYQSVANRILLDADIWGTGNMLLLVKSKQVYNTYRGIK